MSAPDFTQASAALWQSLPVPAFVTDRAGRILAANGAAELFLNKPAQRLRDRTLAGILSSDAALAKALSRAGDDRGPVYVNNAVLAMPGLCKEANIQLAALAGHPDRLLVLVSPCRLARQIDQSGPAGKAARSAIGMAEMLAHEIKNPLAGITGAAQLLEMNLPEADREMTRLIVSESHRIVALLEQVEQFGNLRPPRKTAQNIHVLLDRARRSAELGFARELRFVEEYDPSLPLTEVDADQMMQVLLNLMKNAAEAITRAGEKGGRTDGTITLRTRYDHSLRLRGEDGRDRRLPLQVEIIDDGPGLPPDIAGQVFEPFVSGRENGTGLGLALVSKIIIEHGAWITVDSAPGRTLFRISLPLAAEADRPPGARTADTPEKET